ncbi:MAG: MxaL protein [Gammaproteobacteria bacterium]|nr:MxaL protein [Gammaproteobacteria bacterium]
MTTAIASRLRIRNARVVLLAGALLLVLTTLFDPQLTYQQPRYRFLAVFDITQSMNVTDAGTSYDARLSRLTRAKHTLGEILPHLPCATEMGVGIFTQHRTLPLIAPVEVCANRNELAELIAKLSWEMAWDARSEVAKGLFSALSVAKTLGEHTHIIFFTDGHEAPPINPQFAPRFAGTPGSVTGTMVGVGGEIPRSIPKFDGAGKQRGFWRADEVLQVDTYSLGRFQGGEPMVGVEVGDIAQRIAAGTEHLSSLREAYLQDTARRVGIEYHRLSGARALLEVLLQERNGVSEAAVLDLRAALIAVALLLVLAANLISLASNKNQ